MISGFWNDKRSQFPSICALAFLRFYTIIMLLFYNQKKFEEKKLLPLIFKTSEVLKEPGPEDTLQRLIFLPSLSSHNCFRVLDPSSGQSSHTHLQAMNLFWFSFLHTQQSQSQSPFHLNPIITFRLKFCRACHQLPGFLLD